MTAKAKRATIWALYNYAGAFAAAVFAIYFSQWLVIDNHVSDFKFNMIFVVSSFLLLITAPLFGVLVDKVRVKMPALRLVTVFSFLSLLAVGLLAQFAPANAHIINLVIAFLIIGQYFYQLSFVFYDPLLKELGEETEQAKISGYGEGAAWFGQLSGLIVTLPLATGAIYLLGHRDESQVFIPTALVFLLLVLPMLLFFKEKSKRSKTVTLNIKEEIRNIVEHFLELKRYPGVHRFLLAFFFFNDAILTAGHNFPIYVERVFHADNQTKVILLGSILVAAAIGAVFSGYIAYRVGEKRLLLLLLASWVVILPITALQTEGTK
jgi:UMF1 family MFS transporter